MENRFQRRSFAPIKVGQELDVKIEAVGEKGDGIAKVQGFVIFVPGAKEGEQVKVKVTRVLRKVGFAEVIGEGTGSSNEESNEDSSSNEEESYDNEDDDSSNEED